MNKSDREKLADLLEWLAMNNGACKQMWYETGDPLVAERSSARGETYASVITKVKELFDE